MPEKEDSVSKTELAEVAEDEQHLVLRKLLAAHETMFNVFDQHEYAGRSFEGYAEFHSYGEKYILSKKAKLWEVNAHEYLFFKLVDHLSEAELSEYINWMKTEALGKVDAKKDHMSSFISLVLIANSADEGCYKAVKKASFRKNYLLGFHGWADLRLGLVDLNARKVSVNAAAREMRPTLEANAGLARSKRKFVRR